MSARRDEHSEGRRHGHGPKLATIDAPRWLWLALWLNISITAMEVVVGLLASSTALLTDAAHVITDALAIGLALVAIRIAKRPASRAFTYGFGRVEILSALFNGSLLLLLAAALAVGSIVRLSNPPHVDGALVVTASIFGLAANAGAAWALAKASRRSQAVEGAFQHALLDAVASVAAIIAGSIVVAGGPDATDPVLALLVTALMARSGTRIVVTSVRTLLEGAPSGVDPKAIETALKAPDGVQAINDLHVWEVTDGFPAVTAQVDVRTDVDCHAKRLELQQLMHDQFGIDHFTLQVEHIGATPGDRICSPHHDHA